MLTHAQAGTHIHTYHTHAQAGTHTPAGPHTHTLITHVVGHCFCNNMAPACGYLVRVEASCSRSCSCSHIWWPFYLDHAAQGGSAPAVSVSGSYSKPLSCFLVYAHEAVSSSSFTDSKAGFKNVREVPKSSSPSPILPLPFYLPRPQ